MSEPRMASELRVAWRRNDFAMERDAELFWTNHKVLPRDTIISERLKELCVLAYSGEQLVGVSTAGVRQVAFLGVRLAIFRCAISPESRGQRLSYAMMTRAREAIEEWSAAHREEEVMGMATIAQTQNAFFWRWPGGLQGFGSDLRRLDRQLRGRATGEGCMICVPGAVTHITVD